MNLSRSSTTTTTVVSRPTAAKPGLSFGGINIRGAGFPAKGEPAKSPAPAPPPTPMLFKKKKSKRAAAGVTWPDSHDSLEMVKIFDRREPPAGVTQTRMSRLVCARSMLATPRAREEPAEEPETPDSPEKDEDEDEDDAAAVAKARERQERELAAEARAAQLTRQRRLNEMKAVGRWRSPSRVPYGPDVEISKGPDSTEAPRLRDAARRRRTREAMYADAAAPDSPAEPPRMEMHDDSATPVIPLHPKVTPRAAAAATTATASAATGRMGQRGGAPPALNQAALNSLLSSMQSNPALIANIGAAAQKRRRREKRRSSSAAASRGRFTSGGQDGATGGARGTVRVLQYTARMQAREPVQIQARARRGDAAPVALRARLPVSRCDEGESRLDGFGFDNDSDKAEKKFRDRS